MDRSQPRRIGGADASRAVLGIDAAWTPRHRSGVALAAEIEGRWRMVAIAPSYASFLEHVERIRPAGDLEVDPKRLLAAAAALAGRPVDLVAVDMPLARSPIVGRRPSDTAISKAYAARGAATHSPSATRPGKVSDRLRAGFEAEGFTLATTSIEARSLIEVYPHPALIAFLRAPYRLCYKVGGTLTYWPALDARARRVRLLEVWREILAALETRIVGAEARMPLPGPEIVGAGLKALEDQLDAMVCVAVGIAALNGEATAFGDAESAIWVPAANSD